MLSENTRISGFSQIRREEGSPTLCPIWEVRCSKGQQSKGEIVGEGSGFTLGDGVTSVIIFASALT